jgi:hypothetical protein
VRVVFESTAVMVRRTRPKVSQPQGGAPLTRGVRHIAGVVQEGVPVYLDYYYLTLSRFLVLFLVPSLYSLPPL